ncbi:ATP-grasp domain-containing protein [Streptomyces clavuligerus]|uniref:Biotin carboxylase n=1 Tax=Streptomyces clavuligerus TaxID=1901 RepID=B5GN79_STRCL|nr:ATP-grasp domain-containing protein [Streptomyces clavuligerus]ANW22178.1 hypothetical protein BB341_27970 [Streptomyces clavuligerus]AXU17069.1 ATP-grasp domain-containing protein [Streptomyces clavuligerus]EDY47775.1 conserved hypothetical protein [Streptomyces clavuligerus]EFG04236.1 Biotin carboxylase [Streptomyces clavuligerus]MBY6307287.1 ATP-grasp domain-containing protein [Streptomyces clavuligerus]
MPGTGADRAGSTDREEREENEQDEQAGWEYTGEYPGGEGSIPDDGYGDDADGDRYGDGDGYGGGGGGTVVLVDPYTAARGFPEALAAAGARVVRLRSTPRPLAVFRHAVDPFPYADDLVHDGDLPALVARLRRAGTVAVIPGSEIGVELADALAEALALPTANGTARSAARRDKYLQIERLRAAGVPTTRQLLVRTEAELIRWHKETGRTVVLKPLRGAAGEGVHFCDTPEQSAAALRTLRELRLTTEDPHGGVVAQEYLTGTEYVLNTVSRDGVHHLTDAWRTERVSANGNRDLCVSHVLLSGGYPGLAELFRYGRRVLDALGVRHGPAHLEIKTTPDGPRLVEAGIRSSGGGLPLFAREAIGAGQIEWTVDALLRPGRFHARAGRPYARRTAFAWAGLVSPVAGRLDHYRGLDAIRALDSFRDLTLWVRPGGILTPTVDDTGYPGAVTLAHPVEDILLRDLLTVRHLDGPHLYALSASAVSPAMSATSAMTPSGSGTRGGGADRGSARRTSCHRRQGDDF